MLSRYGRRAYYQVKDPEGVWKLPPPYLSEPPPRSTADDVERLRATLPERLRDAAELTYVSGLHEEWPPPPPKEVTDEELIELGLLERPPAPPAPAEAPLDAAAAAKAMAAMDPQALSNLLQTLQQQQQSSAPPQPQRRS